MRQSTLTATMIDEVLTGTFPASDPPAWTPGMARPAPVIADRPAERPESRIDPNPVQAHEADVIDVSLRDSERTFAHHIVSWIGAAALAVLGGLAIVAVGTLLTLVVRGGLAVAERLLAMLW